MPPIFPDPPYSTIFNVALVSYNIGLTPFIIFIFTASSDLVLLGSTAVIGLHLPTFATARSSSPIERQHPVTFNPSITSIFPHPFTLIILGPSKFPVSHRLPSSRHFIPFCHHYFSKSHKTLVAPSPRAQTSHNRKLVTISVKSSTPPHQ